MTTKNTRNATAKNAIACALAAALALAPCGLALAAPATTAAQGRAKAAQSAYIGASKARDIALKDAGVSKGQCRYVDTQLDLDRDDGPAHYDVEFKVGTREYEYDVNAVTGEIMSRSVEIDD